MNLFPTSSSHIIPPIEVLVLCPTNGAQIMVDNSSVSEVDGFFQISSETFSAREVLQSLLAQGVTIKKVGSTLRVGREIITPVSHTKATSSVHSNAVNPTVVQGLATQVQRIFSEISRLKEQLGLQGVNLPPSGSFNPFLESQEGQPHQQGRYAAGFTDESVTRKWNVGDDERGSSRGTSSVDVRQAPAKHVASSQDVPFYTLGRKSGGSSPSPLEEYQDMTKVQGLSDDAALDQLTSRLFATADQAMYSNHSRPSVRTSISKEEIFATMPNDSHTPGHRVDEDGNPGRHVLFQCPSCLTKLSKGAKFCSKCGKRMK